MKIEWLGHSCFKLTESTGTTIITDPYDSYVGYEMPEVQADVVTISHHHKDHDNVKKVTNNPLIIDELGSWEVKGVDIYTMLTYHDTEDGQKRGENHVTKFRMDGIDICHLGDVGEECTSRIVESIGAVNVLMIPIGGEFTINAEQAKLYVDLLMPDIVIPMHYKTPNCNFDLDKVNAFIKLFDDEQVVELEEKDIELDREKFDGEDTKLYIFSDKQF